MEDAMKCCCRVPVKQEVLQKMQVKVCPRCGLMTKAKRISFEEERIRYDAHKCDFGYYAYIQKVFEKIQSYVVGNTILDYGCGQIHKLADIFLEHGYTSFYYDLHYYPNLKKMIYDTIVLIEVFEHVYEPYEELFRLAKMLDVGGRIILMTQFYDDVDLNSWWYLRDKTHISFIQTKTIEMWNLPLKIIERKEDILVLERI